jgi:hypothetical protein
LIPGSNFRHSILNPIMVNWTPPFLPKEQVHNAIRRVFNIPWVWWAFYGISNPLPMVCRTPYPWYIKHPAYGISKAHHTHGILNTLLMALWTCSFGKNGGVQFTMIVILNPYKIYPGFKIPYGILTPGSIYHKSGIKHNKSNQINIPCGILIPGSNFRHSILNPIMVNWTPPFLPKEQVHNAIRRWHMTPI